MLQPHRFKSMYIFIKFARVSYGFYFQNRAMVVILTLIDRLEISLLDPASFSKNLYFSFTLLIRTNGRGRAHLHFLSPSQKVLELIMSSANNPDVDVASLLLVPKNTFFVRLISIHIQQGLSYPPLSLTSTPGPSMGMCGRLVIFPRLQNIRTPPFFPQTVRR